MYFPVFNNLRQVERSDQEDRHLRARNRAFRAVGARPTSASDAFCRQLFDPGCCPIRGWHICEAGAGSNGRWGVIAPILALEQEDCHLRTRDRILRAVQVRATAASNPVVTQNLDPIFCPMANGVGERRSYIRRREGVRVM